MKITDTLLIALAVIALAVSVFLIADVRAHKQARHEKSIEVGREAGIRVSEALDAKLSAIARRAQAYAQEVASIAAADELLASIRRESAEFPLILGVTVAYEPRVFAGRERFAPFFNKERGEFQYVENSYDYTSAQLATAAWYTRVVRSGLAQWSEPYYAEAAQAMVVDYGVPLLDRQGKVKGVVDYTISLSQLTEVVDSLSVGESGYGFTFDATGAILSHPNPDFLLENVFQLRDGKNQAILDSLRNDSEGVVAYNSTYTYKFSWFFFRELQSTGWKSVLVFAEDDLLGATDQGRRKIIHAALGTSFFLATIMLLLTRLGPVSPHKLWWLVTGLSTLIVANILVIWYLNLSTDFSLLMRNQERIVNKTILNKYVQKYDEQVHKLSGSRYHKVPTGIYIESYELTPFEASLIGKLWMKYPRNLYEESPPGFYFPDISALESRAITSDIISELIFPEHVLVTWKFRVTLEQNFRYEQFPFDQNLIQVRMLYPDFTSNVLLVPDLDSYDILNPSVMPGLNPDIRVPSSQTIASFFDFAVMDYRTTFGNSALNQNHPALNFNMVTRRNWLSPFISNIVPILIVALIMFIVLYISSNREAGRSGLTAMNVIQSAAGFLFILVLAHVNERNRIGTPEIAYIELFYFSMYCFITLQTVALAMLHRGANWSLFRYEDNLVLKLLFWPLLLGTWLGFTLVRFY